MPFPSADTAVTLKKTVSPALAWKSYCSAVSTGGCAHASYGLAHQSALAAHSFGKAYRNGLTCPTVSVRSSYPSFSCSPSLYSLPANVPNHPSCRPLQYCHYTCCEVTDILFPACEKTDSHQTACSHSFFHNILVTDGSTVS